jgi:two-component system sensor histidine kinase BaeS
VGALSYVFAPHALDELVHATVDALPRDQREGMSITLDLAPIEAVVDARRIEQLTRNLLVNALAYTDRPGTIAITLSAADDGIQLVVADSPPTVPAERCAQLFEPLFRMEESRSRRHAGAGLGLAICRKIVAAHQGCITATPATLGGLQITVTLPKRSR